MFHLPLFSILFHDKDSCNNNDKLNNLISDSYEETAQIPVYLNDTRFDHIELPWLDNCKPVKLTKECQPQKLPQEKPAPVKNEAPICKHEKDKSKILISKGVMSTQDLFFVKSIEEYCSETTLIWFIESLKNKYVPDRFHKSCLARDICCADYKVNEGSFNGLDTNYYFNLMVYK